MASESKQAWHVTDVTTCPMCLKDCRNAKLLPCLHSFCLKCLQGYCEGKKSDEFACQVCNTKFEIPSNGVKKLPDNFFVQNLIDAISVANNKPEEVLCEVCMVANDDDEDIHPATVYCADCSRKMCKRCSRSCRVQSGGTSHDVKPLSAENIQQRDRHCDQHRAERLKLYCRDCESNICSMCFATNHCGHKCGDIVQLAKDFTSVFDVYVRDVSSRIEDYNAAVEQVADETAKFQRAVSDNKTIVQRKVEEVQQTVENHATEMLATLDTEESDGLEDADNRSKKIQLALTSLWSFKVYLEELMAKGSPCDITGAAKAMRCRAKELLEIYAKPSDYQAPRVSYSPINVDKVIHDGQHTTGRITIQISVGEQKDFEDPRKTRERELEKQLQLSEERAKALQKDLESATVQKEVLFRQVTRIQMILNSDARAAQTLNGHLRRVIGTTSLDLKLYVLRRDMPHIDVYSATNFSKLPKVALAEQQPYKDIAACARNKCLYILGSNYVYKKELNGPGIKWPVSGSLISLSVTPNGNVLVLSEDSGMTGNPSQPYLLQEISSQSGLSLCIDLIKLSISKEYPQNALLMTSGQFVVCYYKGWLGANGVSIFDEEGNTIRSYGSESNSAYLSYPRHVAMDKDSQFVFIADSENRRVVLLTSKLEFIRCVIEGLPGKPHRLHVDQETSHLYVGLDNGDVIVVEL